MPASSVDMVMIHRVFRRELALLPGQVRAVPDGDRARVERIAAHADLMLLTLKHHHESEDLLLWPLLRQRAPEQLPLLDMMDAQHERIHSGLDAVHATLATWRATGRAEDGEQLARHAEALLPVLVKHLDAEEAGVLPLVDALLDQEEWNLVGERASGALAPSDALIVLAQMAEETPAQDWATFLANLPPPVQDVYAVHAEDVYARYLSQVRGT